jgi:hypothetical protein
MQPAGGANLSATTVPGRPRAAARPTVSGITQIATYATALAGIYLSVGFLFYFAMKEKLFTDSGTKPVGLQKAFHGSFFASIPGDNAAWVLLGLIEALVVVLLAVSLVRGEFLPQRRKPILLAGLSVSVFAYAVMIVANAMIGNNPDRDRAVHLPRRDRRGDVPRQADVALPADELAGGRVRRVIR